MILNSPYITGSLTVSCNVNICGSINGTTNICTATVFASTRVCSPNLCATTTICGPAFIGGTMSGTTLYGSTVVCAPTVFGSSVVCGGSICTTGNVCAAGSITGSAILSTGRITAQTLVVSTISSSVTFSSGSNIFGNNPANTQTMTGSLRVSGSSDHFILGCNVGIGTCSPDRRLYVANTSATQGTFLAYNQCTSFTGTVIQAITDRTCNSAFNLMDLRASTVTQFIVKGDGSVGIGTALPTATLHISGSNTSCLLRVSSPGAPNSLFVSGSGNVGIGTTSPSFGLEVFSSAQTAITSNNTFGANFNIIFNRDNTGSTRNCFNLLADQNSGYIRTLDNYPITFVTNGQNRLSISNTGITSFCCQVCSGNGFYASSLQSGVTIDSTTNGDTIIASRGLSSALHGIVRTVGQNGVTCAMLISTRSTVDGNLPASVNALWGLTNHDMVIATNNAERMRISSAGTASFTANALASSGDAATITLKQNSTTATSGIYLERSGEQKGYYMYVGGSVDSLTFQRNNAGTKGDVMALSRDGNVGIGTTDPKARLQVGDGSQTAINGAGNKIHIASATSGGRSALITLANSTGGTTVEGQFESSAETGDLRIIIGSTSNHDIAFRSNNVERMRITNGGIACFSTTVCAPCFATISDYRMKHNLRPIQGLSIIMNTKPYKFDYNYDCSTSFGMIAHELQETLPEAVFGEKDGEVMQGVDYMKLLPIAIKAIQEQQSQICTQASTITQLKTCLGLI